MDVPQAPAQPPVQLLGVETLKPPQPIKQKPATALPVEDAIRQRVNVKNHVTTTPGHATRKKTQTRTHVIPDDTEACAPMTHLYNGNSGKIPPVHRYNTRARIMQCHDLMAN